MSFHLMARALNIKTGSSNTKIVLLKLCDNANDEGECWPSQEKIADQCEISKRTVVNSIKRLEEQGLLTVLKCSKNKNKYQLNLSSAKSAPLNSVVQNLHTSSAGSALLSSAKSALPYIEPINNKPINESIIKKTNKKGHDSDFEAFWMDYPRKIGKGAARKAFEKALKKSSFSEIISGLLGHEIQTKKELQFIPYPATWLNQERWTDESSQKEDAWKI